MTDTGVALTHLRERAPLTHVVTNYVAMGVTANVLLAAGAAPAMIHAEAEAAEFAAIADALSVNIGTLSPSWLSAMESAAVAARAAKKPWVFDPVAAGATAYRRRAAAGLLAERPAVVRGNASEILALAGLDGRGRGVDAGDTVEAAFEAAKTLATAQGCVVAVTGATDVVTDGDRSLKVSGGAAVMTRVTALGCALSSLTAAFVACGDDPLEATAAALGYYKLAGERAAATAPGPGAFAVAFLDALAAIDGADLSASARIDAL